MTGEINFQNNQPLPGAAGSSPDVTSTSNSRGHKFTAKVFVARIFNIFRNFVLEPLEQKDTQPNFNPPSDSRSPPPQHTPITNPDPWAAVPRYAPPEDTWANVPRYDPPEDPWAAVPRYESTTDPWANVPSYKPQDNDRISNDLQQHNYCHINVDNDQICVKINQLGLEVILKKTGESEVKVQNEELVNETKIKQLKDVADLVFNAVYGEDGGFRGEIGVIDDNIEKAVKPVFNFLKRDSLTSEKLGEGTFGVAYKIENAVDINTPFVIKEAKNIENNESGTKKARADVQNEVKILVDLHSKYEKEHNGEPLPGVMKKPHAIFNLSDNSNKEVGYMGGYYNQGGLHIYSPRASSTTNQDRGGINSLFEQFNKMQKGLEFMHVNNYFHGDIKPQNILCHNNELFLADFGGARHISGAEHINDTVDITFSCAYRFQKLSNEMKIAHTRGDIETIKKLLSKSDKIALQLSLIQTLIRLYSPLGESELQQIIQQDENGFLIGIDRDRVKEILTNLTTDEGTKGLITNLLNEFNELTDEYNNYDKTFKFNNNNFIKIKDLLGI